MNDAEQKLRKAVIDAMIEAWVPIAEKEAPPERVQEFRQAAWNEAVLLGGRGDIETVAAMHQTHERMVGFFARMARSTPGLMERITGKTNTSN